MDNSKFVLVLAESLPEIFGKVLYAKKLLAQGKARNSSEAARMAGISRSAFYKYKNCVFTYDKGLGEKMVNLYIKLEDEPGILSAVLSALYKEGVNIITVNQNIPVDGVAPVSICAKINNPQTDIGDLLNFLEKISGVVEARDIN